jgi:hypothetical protein
LRSIEIAHTLTQSSQFDWNGFKFAKNEKNAKVTKKRLFNALPHNIGRFFM